MSRTGTRIFSVFLLAICLALIYAGWDIKTEFSYEPLGPRPFPIWTLIFLSIGCVLLFFFAEKIEVDWGDKNLYKKLGALLISFIVFASIFEYLGFIIATTFVVFCVSMLFQARIVYALILAVISGFALYYLFNELLQVTLPLGLVFE